MAESANEWITIEDAAELLGVSLATVTNDIRGGRLTHQDRGEGRRPRWFVSRTHVQQIIEEGGREDRRKQRTASPQPGSSEASELAAEVEELRGRLQAAHDEIAALRAEVARLRVAARNANVAVQTQTETIQQYLVEDQP